MLLGCALALSACNTTADGTSGKTALFTETKSAEKTAPVDMAQVSVAPGVAKDGVATGEEAATGEQMVASLAMPVLPMTGPVPAMRAAPPSVLAYSTPDASAVETAAAAAETAFNTPSNAPQNLDTLIAKYSVANNVPERLVRRVVHRESRYNPAARNGPYWGLMQISHPTARGMGYSGAPKGLLDAETNLKYAVRYLSGAYKVAGGNENQAVRFYSRGYYYDAKRKGLLQETGLDGSYRGAAD